MAATTRPSRAKTTFTCPSCGAVKALRKAVRYNLDTLASSHVACADCFGTACVDPAFRARIVR